MDAVKFTLEVQSVVAMRLMKIAAGGATGAAESTENASGEGGGLDGHHDRWSARARKRQERKGGHESGNGTSQEARAGKSEAAIRPEVTAHPAGRGRLSERASSAAVL
jgi:hypothetical protein